LILITHSIYESVGTSLLLKIIHYPIIQITSVDMSDVIKT